MKARLRRLGIDALVREWFGASLFPACPPHMRAVIAEFKQRGIAMTPVLDDHHRRLVEDERERQEANP
jgi:hypothetical protein